MIIGLVGLIGSGKGAAGDILCQNGFERDSFAAPVKDAVSVIFGWSRSLLEGDTEDSRNWRELPDMWWSERLGKPFSPRLALQLMGTEAGRNGIHTDIWLRSLERRIEGKNVVITDTRFPNEVEFIRNRGGVIVEIKRGNDPDWYHLAELEDESHMRYAYPDVHYSEWAWIGCKIDGVIKNDGTIEDLTNKLKSDILFS